MHIHGSLSELGNAKMSGCSVDIRLRRQQPVSSSRPPRVRQGGRSLSLVSARRTSQVVEPKHQHTNSWHGVRSLRKIGDTAQDIRGSTGDISSCVHSGRGHVRSQSHDWDNTTATNQSQNSRPLIHHQRHNLKNRFQLLKTLGEGTYGKVKLAAECSTGEYVAIKYIKKTKIQDENDLVRIRREIQILSSLKHPHIVNIREVFEKKDKIVLVMDYAQGGELYDYLNRMGRLGEVDARRIFRQIVSAMHYCHQHGIVHRDLKLENIILDDQGNVKIADFGLANYYSHNDTLKTFCGSPLYASPEIVNGKPYHGPEVDVWSLGVVLYTLVYGAMPFESNSLISLKQSISQGDYNQPAKPSDAAGLIRHMLTVTPSRRATMEDALRHWWVNFGHAHMPNDAPYSPDDESATVPSGVTTGIGNGRASARSHGEPDPTPSMTSTTSSSTCLRHQPGGVNHQRNQSSISSDSDLELDFRPSCLARLDSAVVPSSSSSSSPADSKSYPGSIGSSDSPTADASSSCSSYSSYSSSSSSSTFALANFTTILSVESRERREADLEALRLPESVLEILNGGSKNAALAEVFGTDKISTGFDLDNTTSPSPVPLPEEEDRKKGKEGDKNGSTVFDSEKKPKRGILKRRGKFSGGDSGCVMHEVMAANSEETPVPKSGHLPKRIPSFKGEAHGIFASRHRISQLLDATNDPNNPSACAIPESAPVAPPPSSSSVSASSTPSPLYPVSTSQPSLSHHSPSPSHPEPLQHHHYQQLQQQPNQSRPLMPQVPQQRNNIPETFSSFPEVPPPYNVPTLPSPSPDPLPNPHHPHYERQHNNHDLGGHRYTSSAPDNANREEASCHSISSSAKATPNFSSPQSQAAFSNANGFTAFQSCYTSASSSSSSSSPSSRLSQRRSLSQPSLLHLSDNDAASGSPLALSAASDSNRVVDDLNNGAEDILNKDNANHNDSNNGRVQSNTFSPSSLGSSSSSNNNNNSNKESHTTAATTTKVVRRPKSILKTSRSSQQFNNEARNRLSVSSIGSNSSADFLDLSYDSGDCDHFVNNAARLPISPSEKNGVRHGNNTGHGRGGGSGSSSVSLQSGSLSPPESVDGGDRNSMCLDEDYQSGKIYPEDLPSTETALTDQNGLSPSQQPPVLPTSAPPPPPPPGKSTFQGQVDSHGNPIFDESESPMLYRLAKEARELALQ